MDIFVNSIPIEVWRRKGEQFIYSPLTNNAYRIVKMDNDSPIYKDIVGSRKKILKMRAWLAIFRYLYLIVEPDIYQHTVRMFA